MIDDMYDVFAFGILDFSIRMCLKLCLRKEKRSLLLWVYLNLQTTTK